MNTIEPADFTILMVDDTPRNLQLLGSTLKNEQYKLEFATSGKKALEWLKKKTFDLILLDVMMPEMTGFEVCIEIRANRDYDDMPIIFLTAKTDKESIVKGFDLGAQDYVTKPFDTKELLARVRTHLELKYSKEKLKSVNKWLEEMVRERTKELEEANIKLDEANKELLNLDKAKSEFLRMISHEIRTPLNGIMGPLHLLKNKIESEDLMKLVNILDYSVARLEEYTMAALKITELKSKSFYLEKQPVNLKELVEFCLIELSGTFKNYNVLVNTKFKEGDYIIEANYELLFKAIKTILAGLAENYYNEGDMEIQLIKQGEKMAISIINNKIKISSEKIAHQFGLVEDFTDVTHHTSLYVYLANIIIELHNGIIQVDKIKDGILVKLTL